MPKRMFSETSEKTCYRDISWTTFPAICPLRERIGCVCALATSKISAWRYHLKGFLNLKTGPRHLDCFNSNKIVWICAHPSEHCNHSTLQNDKINCNGSFRDITMYFVKDPCVNVSILWIIIMYHVKHSCCSTSKIHWDMSNFWCT